MRGIPVDWDELKIKRTMMLTDTAWNNLEKRASELGVSRSEYIERVARGVISKVLTPKDKQTVKQALVQLVAWANDELATYHLLEDRRTEGESAATLRKQIEIWQKLLEKLQ